MMRQIILTAAILFGACLQSMALGQSDADLRRENQRLQAENDELTKELDAARQRIAELERETARLRRQLRSLRGGETAPDAPEDEEELLRPVSVDESDPAASPNSLLTVLMDSYDAALADLEVGAPQSPERAQYLRTLREWRDQVQRDHRRTAIEWHVRVLESMPSGRGLALRVIVIDPVNGAQLGSPFSLLLPRNMARRYELLSAHMDEDVFLVRGMMAPNININETRTAPGPFNNPPFIGPFAEFNFDIEVRSIARPNDAEQ